jgi:hypothetical protein
MSITIKTPVRWDKATALAVLDAYIEGLERGYTLTIIEQEGECDKCAASYDVSSRDNRCGDCGNCDTCCTHKGEDK